MTVHIESKVYTVSANYDICPETLLRLGKHTSPGYRFIRPSYYSKLVNNESIEIQFIRFDYATREEEKFKMLNTHRIIDFIKNVGCRGINIHELMVLRAKYLEINFPVAALGTYWKDSDNYSFYSVLDTTKPMRNVFLEWIGHGGSSSFRYPVVSL